MIYQKIDKLSQDEQMRTSELKSKVQALEAYMDLEEEYQRDEQYGGVEVVVVQQPTKRRRRIDEQTSEYVMIFRLWYISIDIGSQACLSICLYVDLPRLVVLYDGQQL